MPANLLILPLLAGFWFLHHCHKYRFRALNWDGYRLLLESAIKGLIFLSLARGLIIAFEFLPSAKRLVTTAWNPIAPIPYLGSALGSFVLAGLGSFADNRSLTPSGLRQLYRCFKDRRAESLGYRQAFRGAVRDAYSINSENGSMNAIQSYGNPLVRLLDSAARNYTAVSITLNNRKWYVGFVSEAISLDPKQTHFRLTPLFSGFRQKDTLTATPELSYARLYAGIRNKKSKLHPKRLRPYCPHRRRGNSQLLSGRLLSPVFCHSRWEKYCWSETRRRSPDGTFRFRNAYRLNG